MNLIAVPSCSNGRWRYPIDIAISFSNTYRLDSDLSDGERHPAIQQLWGIKIK